MTTAKRSRAKKSYDADPWVPLSGRALAAAIRAKGVSVRAFAVAAGERPQTVQKLVNSGKTCRASRRANLAEHLAVSEAFLAGEDVGLGWRRHALPGEAAVDFVEGSSTPRLQTDPHAAPPIVALKVEQLVELMTRVLRRPRMTAVRVTDEDEQTLSAIDATFREARQLRYTEDLHADLVSLLSLEQWRAYVLGDERWNWYPSPAEEDRFAELVAEAITLVLAPLLRNERRMPPTSNRDLEAIGVVRELARRIRDA